MAEANKEQQPPEGGAPKAPAPDPTQELNGEATEEVSVDLTEDEIKNAGIDVAHPEPAPEPDPAADKKDADVTTAPEDKPRKKNRVPAKQRIGQLTAEGRRLQEELQSLRGNYQKTEQEKEHATTAAFKHYKSSVDANLRLAQREYKDAVEAGDADAQSTANSRVAQYASQKSEIENWEEQQAAIAPTAGPAPKAQPQPQNVAPDTQSWIDQNSWFDMQSDDFDQDMHDDAVLIGSRIERKYKDAGKGSMIGSAEYFAEVDEAMKKQWPEYYDDEPPPTPKGQPKMKASNQPVAPAPSDGTPMPGAKPQSPTSVTLSSEERQIAHGLGMRHGNGKQFTNAEHERAYALQKLRLQKSGL